MGFNFPASPALGATYSPGAGLPVYQWDGEKWKASTAVAGISTVYVSDTAPSTPVEKSLWWESDTGLLYVRYNDGDSVQWVLVGNFPSLAGFVRHDAAQSLTDAQKTQARENIGVVKKNYIVNGTAMVSQENAAAAGTTAGYHPVDQFAIDFTTSGTLSVAQVASQTPGGSPNRIRVTVTAADAAVAAGDVVFLYQKMEGLRIADLMLGSTSAKALVLRFGCKGPAGTYGVAFVNGTGNRSRVEEYTISALEANTDVVKSVTLPGDVTGTWVKDNTLALSLRWGLMAGTTWQQAAGAWGTGNVISSANQFNFMGTNGNVFELFDVGLYEGSVVPVYIAPLYEEELRACMRYYRRTIGITNSEPSLWSYSAAGGNSSGYSVTFPVPMRVTPTIAFTGTWTVSNCAQPASGGADSYSYGLYTTATAAGMFHFQPNNSGRVSFNARL